MEVLGQIVFQNAAWHGLAPGENAGVTVQVQFPVVVREGTRFAIRENGRTVGAGIVTKVL
jgi:translation elongation factor EF-Tu-like GTPase